MKTTLPIIAACLAMALCSCNPKFYSPTSQNVPLMQEQGQTNLSGNVSDKRAEVQAAYAVTNHMAIQANGGVFYPKNIESGDGGSGQFIEGGIGYFTPVYESFVFETYAIVGGGRMENHFPSSMGDQPGTNGNISASLMRYGIQPSFGFHTKYFSMALSTRLAMLTYSNIDGNLIYGNENQQAYLRDNDDNFLFEPALTFRGGSERVKLQLQFIRSYNFSNPRFKQDFSVVTLGLNVNFPK